MATGSGSGSGAGGVRPATGAGGIAARECESCRSAPGIPFCRVEWSFLCGSCAPIVHGNSWIIAVPPYPNTNPNPNSYPYPYGYPSYAIPNPNPNPNPNPEPNHVVQLSSDEEEADAEGGGVRRRRRRRLSGSAEAPGPHERVASVMRYKEKRKSRRYDKTVRYEARKAYAELRPRVDGKFARAESAGDEAGADPEAEERPGSAVQGEVGVQPDGVELGKVDDEEQVGLLSSDHQ
ncbi:uncharacterized protein [Typha angustifolia]|uniref:uncharacterized protein n=1 Tax=Typha angustifolia TaxID=59011 RepID=UPI003C30D04D